MELGGTPSNPTNGGTPGEGSMIYFFAIAKTEYNFIIIPEMVSFLNTSEELTGGKIAFFKNTQPQIKKIFLELVSEYQKDQMRVNGFERMTRTQLNMMYGYLPKLNLNPRDTSMILNKIKGLLKGSTDRLINADKSNHGECICGYGDRIFGDTEVFQLGRIIQEVRGHPELPKVSIADLLNIVSTPGDVKALLVDMTLKQVVKTLYNVLVLENIYFCKINIKTMISIISHIDTKTFDLTELKEMPFAYSQIAMLIHFNPIELKTIVNQIEECEDHKAVQKIKSLYKLKTRKKGKKGKKKKILCLDQLIKDVASSLFTLSLINKSFRDQIPVLHHQVPEPSQDTLDHLHTITCSDTLGRAHLVHGFIYVTGDTKHDVNNTRSSIKMDLLKMSTKKALMYLSSIDSLVFWYLRTLTPNHLTAIIPIYKSVKEAIQCDRREYLFDKKWTMYQMAIWFWVHLTSGRRIKLTDKQKRYVQIAMECKIIKLVDQGAKDYLQEMLEINEDPGRTCDILPFPIRVWQLHYTAYMANGGQPIAISLSLDGDTLGEQKITKISTTPRKKSSKSSRTYNAPVAYQESSLPSLSKQDECSNKVCPEEEFDECETYHSGWNAPMLCLECALKLKAIEDEKEWGIQENRRLEKIKKYRHNDRKRGVSQNMSELKKKDDKKVQGENIVIKKKGLNGPKKRNGIEHAPFSKTVSLVPSQREQMIIMRNHTSVISFPKPKDQPKNAKRRAKKKAKKAEKKVQKATKTLDVTGWNCSTCTFWNTTSEVCVVCNL
jgi:hypothetical protein